MAGEAMDFEAARVKMVEHQIRTTDVTAHSVLEAFYAVPREEFVPDRLKALAYIDADTEIAPGRFLMEASPLAKLMQLAAITSKDKVLEVGAGTGYVTAILARLAGSVVALESDVDLAAKAGEILGGMPFGNFSIVHGDLEAGAPGRGPFDLIFLDGAVEEIPAAFGEQLKDGGRIVGVVGYGNAARAVMLVKERGVLSEGLHFNASVKPLPGFRKAREFVF